MNINSVIKARLTEMGAGSYTVFLPPFIEEIIRERVEAKTRELEEEVKALITDRVVTRAFKAHTTAQKNKLNQKGNYPNETNQ